MKDEIKEILDNPKILMLSYGNYISLDDYVKLKDYITNLQEENERLNKLIELHIDKEDNLVDEIIYKSRNEKAIEKLKTLMPICIMPNNMLIHGTEKAKTIEETLNILQGSDKDE